MAGGMNFPPLSEMLSSDNFQRHLKTHLFRLHLTSASNRENKNLCSLSLSSPCEGLQILF